MAIHPATHPEQIPIRSIREHAPCEVRIIPGDPPALSIQGAGIWCSGSPNLGRRTGLLDSRRSVYRVGPTVSAIFAPRRPSGFGSPTVLSLAVWCSVSAFSLAPIRMTITDSHIQVMKPITAPNEP
jgi:hypothetical protein